MKLIAAAGMAVFLTAFRDNGFPFWRHKIKKHILE
jgi:hypothetical protein